MTKTSQRKELVELYEQGVSVNDICEEHNVPKSTFYRWIRKTRVGSTEISDDDIRIIVTRIAELEEEAMTYKKVLDLLKRAEK